MSALPTIKSIGPPPERHAERMAAEMARWLIAEAHAREDAWHDAVTRRDDGNPAAQQRLVAKLKRIGGPIVFAFSLYPGKRRKYKLYLHRWIGWNNGVAISKADGVPDSPWLACVVQRIVSTYAKVETVEIVTALIGQHAIARIAERCGARTPSDILDHAQRLSSAVTQAMIDRDADGPSREQSWRIPYDGGVARLVPDEATGYPLVVTVLPPDPKSDTWD